MLKTVEFRKTNQYVDRVEDAEAILNDIYKMNESQVHIIYAKTAIGKSTLTAKVIEDAKIVNCIKIITPPENNSSNAAEWLYVDLVFKNLDEFFRHDKNLNFEKYCITDKHIRKQIDGKLIDDLNSGSGNFKTLKTLTFYMIKRVLKLGEFDVYKTISENSVFSRLIKTKYIEHILLNTKLIICIDNLQNIDERSLKYLCDWISGTKKMCHYFLFEYTISENHDEEDVIAIADRLSETGVSIKHSELKQIPVEYAIEIVNNHFENLPNDINFNINLFHNYEKSDGNLRKLLHYTICYNENKDSLNTNENPIYINIVKLSDKSKYILALLIYNNGSINDISACYVLGVDKNQLLEELEELCNNLFINYTNGLISISHASLTDCWCDNRNSFCKIDNFAYKTLEKFYTKQLETESCDFVPLDLSWQILLQMYAAKEPVKIGTLLDQLDNGAIRNISPENTWGYLDKLIKCTENNLYEFKDLYFRILSMCFQLELYEEGYNCLLLMEICLPDKYKESLLLRKAMFYSALDKHAENIRLYEDNIKTLPPYEKAYLNLSLIVLCSYGSLNMHDKCIDIHRDLLSYKGIKSTIEYAFLMRLTNIYLSDYKAADYAKKSIRAFEEAGDLYQSGKSMITYAKLLSGMGQGKKAIKVIEKAEKTLYNQRVGKHMIFSNKAAFLLMNGCYDKKVWDLLDLSECYAKVPYDKLAIIVNKLTWCYENKKYDTIELLINRAEDIIPYEPDEHVHVLIYYNLYLIYSDMKIADKTDYYYKLAYNNRHKCSFVKARFDGDISSDMKYRIKHPWHVCYLSYWTYDINNL